MQATYKRKRAAIRILTLSNSATAGLLTFGALTFPVAIGRGGVRALKVEGDGATPMGFWPLQCVYYRSDRIRRPLTALPAKPIRPSDGWCDAPGDRNYNRKVLMPYPASAERLWRQDRLYDLIVVLGYNGNPRVRGRGSAIFLHVARRGLTPTAGCIAMKRERLFQLLAATPRLSGVSVKETQRPRQRGRRGLR